MGVVQADLLWMGGIYMFYSNASIFDDTEAGI